MGDLLEAIGEWESLFSLYYDAERRATKLWQDRTGEELVWPDKCK